MIFLEGKTSSSSSFIWLTDDISITSLSDVHGVIVSKIFLLLIKSTNKELALEEIGWPPSKAFLIESSSSFHEVPILYI